MGKNKQKLRPSREKIASYWPNNSTLCNVVPEVKRLRACPAIWGLRFESQPLHKERKRRCTEEVHIKRKSTCISILGGTIERLAKLF